jgi:hypothetical protein
MVSGDNAEFATGTVRYIGEVLLRATPARWGYQDRGDDDLNPYNRTVVIRSNTPPEFTTGVTLEFYLHQLIRDRKPGALRKSVDPLRNACAEAGHAEVPGTSEAGRSVPDWCAFFTPTSTAGSPKRKSLNTSRASARNRAIVVWSVPS